MQLRMSKRSRSSSLRKRHTSSKSAGSTVTNGSIAWRFLDRIRSPNFCSSSATISAAVIIPVLTLQEGHHEIHEKHEKRREDDQKELIGHHSPSLSLFRVFRVFRGDPLGDPSFTP